MIRPATISDTEAVLALNNAALPAVTITSQAEIKWFLEQATLFWVLEHADRIVGFLIVLGPGITYDSDNYRFFSSQYGAFDYVDRIVIKDSERGKGYGVDLYRKLFAEAHSPVVTCEVNLDPPNPHSYYFHEKLGFQEVGRHVTQPDAKLVSLMARSISKD
ncbi:MAG: GNAT family N-acetyltransferase [Bacteroidota bacterium]